MLVLRTQERKDDSATSKYTHPSTAAVAHVTVTTDNYESELPGSPEGGRLPPLAPGMRGFSSSIEYGGEGSPLRSSLRNSSLSDPFSPRSPRVTFVGNVPIDTRPTEDGEQARASSCDERGSVDAGPARQSRGESGSSTDARASGQRGSSVAPTDDDDAKRPSRASSDATAAKKSTAGQEDTDAAGARPSTAEEDAAKRSSRASSDATAAKKSTAGQEDTDAAGARPSTAKEDAGRASQAAKASTAPGTSTEEAKKSSADAGERASTDNTSKNNPRSNVNANATEPQNTGNVLLRFYRKLFPKRRQSQNDVDAAAASTSESPTTTTVVNTNANNVVEPRDGIGTCIPPSTPLEGDPTPSPSSGARAGLPSVVGVRDPFVDEQDADDVDDSEYDDDDDDETASTESDNDTNNEYTRLLRHRRQPLPDLSQLCRTSFRGRTLAGSAWSSRAPYSQVNSSGRRRYDTLGVGETSSD